MAQISLNYNLEEVSTEFEPLPSGQYLAKIVNPDDFTLTKSQNGNDMIKVAWTITEGEYEGRKVFDNIALHVPWKVKQYCEAAGIESGTNLDTDDFIGLEALIQVNQEEYQGQARNKVKNVSAAE